MMATFQVLTLRDSGFRSSPYKLRREHHKTKSGCLTCRAKRVKCDERKPVCMRCDRNQRECSYEPLRELKRPILSSKSSISSGKLVEDLLPVLPLRRLSTAPNEKRTNRLLLCFLQCSKDIFHLYRDNELMKMLKSSELVRNTVLAATASYLRHLSSDEKDIRVAEHHHQSLVIESLRETLNTPQEHLGQNGAKELLLSITLLNVVSFTLPDHESEEPQRSWVFSKDENRLSWLALQTGVRPVLLSLTLYIEDVMGFLGPIFMGSAEKGRKFRNAPHELVDVPTSWMEVFQLRDPKGETGCDPASADSTDLYQLAVVYLLRVRQIELLPSNAYLCFLFLNKLALPFRNLLYRHDPRALWLLGYWLGFMRRFEGVWWLAKRVTRDHRAIISYLEELHLEQLPGREGSNWAELMQDLRFAPEYNLK